jgi:hypothetical protein
MTIAINFARMEKALNGRIKRIFTAQRERNALQIAAQSQSSAGEIGSGRQLRRQRVRLTG